MDAEHNHYAPPTAHIQHNTYPLSNSYIYENVELATRRSRLAAFLLDWLIAFLLFLPFWFGPVTGLNSPELRIYGAFFTLAGTITIAISNLYLLARNGQTIGKKLLNIKIIRTDHRTRAGLGRILIRRYLPFAFLFVLSPLISFFIQSINYLWILGIDRRCLHDLLADTDVVRILPPAQ